MASTPCFTSSAFKTQPILASKSSYFNEILSLVDKGGLLSVVAGTGNILNLLLSTSAPKQSNHSLSIL
jgi:hypothetical protein